MTTDSDWQQLTTRREARVLQSFTCTSEHPRTPGGRRLPHPRPWEWEAQRHLRQLPQLLQPGDVALVARSADEVSGVAHLRLDSDDGVMVLFHAAVGVAVGSRGQGGTLADQLLTQVKTIGLQWAADDGCTHLVLTGKVHVSNHASQRMMTRAGWEPTPGPTNEYQSWASVIRLA